MKKTAWVAPGKWAVVAGGIVWGSFLVNAGCGSRTERQVAALAEQFFEHVREGRIEPAFSMVAEGASTLDEFRENLAGSGIVGHQRVAWEIPYVDKEYGRIRGTVLTGDGQWRRMEVVAFKKGRTWEIHMVREAPDETPFVPLPLLPTREEAVAMAMESNAHFLDAVKAGSMRGFHLHVSHALQEQMSVEQLDEKFSVFYECQTAGADFSKVKSGRLELDDAMTFDSDGVLFLRGGYRDPGRIEFDHRYIQEDGRWKLSGFTMVLNDLTEWDP